MGFMWNLSLPPKVRNFWRSAVHNCIPKNMNLLRHYVRVNDVCSLCGFPYDSTCHSLFHYATIMKLWKTTPFSSSVKASIGDDIFEFCSWMKEQWIKEQFEEFAIHGWVVWKERQKVIHGEGGKLLPTTLSLSTSLLEDF